MASNQELNNKMGELGGQAQALKDQAVNKASETYKSAAQSCQDGKEQAVDKASATYDATAQSCQDNKEQAGGLIHDTVEQAKSTAQGATDAVKNTLGIDKN